MLTAQAQGARQIVEGMRSMEHAVVALGKLRLRVGILGPGATQLEEGSSLTLAALGAIHEFGAPEAGIPERSFFRSTMANRAADLKALWASELRLVIGRQKTPRQAMEEVGQQIVAWIKATIRAGIEPPLWEETVRRKGSSKPLIDDGQLINSIVYEVIEVA
jgi:hypothetical protein